MLPDISLGSACFYSYLTAYLVDMVAHTLEEGHDVGGRSRVDKASLVEPKTDPEVVYLLAIQAIDINEE
jgi:hypothetical protein